MSFNGEFDDTTNDPSVYPSYPGKFGLVDASRHDELYGFIAYAVFFDEYIVVTLADEHVNVSGMVDSDWESSNNGTLCNCNNQIFRCWFNDPDNCLPCDGCVSDELAFCVNTDSAST